MDLQHRHIYADRPVHAQRALIVALAASMLWAGPATAQISVEVSPLRVELTAGAGSTTTQGITVSNAGKDPIRVRARLTDWELSRDGAPQFESAVENGPYSATGWLRIAPPEQVIDPGKDAVVRFSMTVPQQIEPGGYRTGVLFEFGPAGGDPIARGREVMFKSRIATLDLHQHRPATSRGGADRLAIARSRSAAADRRHGQEHQPAIGSHEREPGGCERGRADSS